MVVQEEVQLLGLHGLCPMQEQQMAACEQPCLQELAGGHAGLAAAGSAGSAAAAWHAALAPVPVIWSQQALHRKHLLGPWKLGCWVQSGKPAAVYSVTL